MFFNSQIRWTCRRLQKVYWADSFDGVVDQRYIDYRVHIGEFHANVTCRDLIYFAAMLRFRLSSWRSHRIVDFPRIVRPRPVLSRSS